METDTQRDDSLDVASKIAAQAQRDRDQSAAYALARAAGAAVCIGQAEDANDAILELVGL